MRLFWHDFAVPLLGASTTLAISLMSHAQIPLPTVPDNGLNIMNPIGTPPRASAEGTNESVNFANGALTVYIPVLSLPQRGGWTLPIAYIHHSNNMRQVQLTSVFSDLIQTGGNGGQGQTCPSNPVSYLVTSVGYLELMQTRDGVLVPNLPRLQAAEEYAGSIIICSSPPTYSDLYCLTNWIFTDWDGNAHPFANVATCNWDGSGLTFEELEVTESTDGSFYSLNTSSLKGVSSGTVTVTAKDGTTYTFTAPNPFPQENNTITGSQNEAYFDSRAFTMVDPNGNTVSATPTQNGGYTLTDTLNRQVTIGSSGVSYTDSNGVSRTVQVSSPVAGPTGDAYTFPNVHCSQNFPSQKPPFSNPSITNPQAAQTSTTSQLTITFPPVDSQNNSKVYTILYNAADQIVRIEYPSGGYSRYVYFDYGGASGFTYMGNIECNLFNDLQVHYRCQNTASSSMYSGACTSPETGTEYTVSAFGSANNNSNITPFNATISTTDPVGRTTTHDFAVQAQSSIAPVETEVDQYDSAGNKIQTVTKTNYTSAPFTELSYPQTVTTTWFDVSPAISSRIQYQYTDPYTATFTRAGGRQQVYLDMPTEVDEYDFGQVEKKKTVNTWAQSGHFSSNAHILNRPLSTTVTDLVTTPTNLQKTTTYTYDYGANTLGNLTATSTSATNATTANTAYVRDRYGRVTQFTDALNHSTEFYYDGSSGGSSCATNGGNADSHCSPSGSAFPTTVKNPLNQCTVYTYYSCTGTTASVTDPNQATTSYQLDGIQRLIHTSFPDGGGETLQYVDTGQNSVTDSKLENATTSIVAETLFDGLGRKSRTELTSDPTGIVYTDFGYDNAGNLSTVSNSYRSTLDPTYGITTYSYMNGNDGYDPFDRVWAQTEEDSSTQLHSYSGNVIDVTDEDGNEWQKTSDAMGNLVSAKEPGPGYTKTPGLSTTYSYDGFNNLRAVTQSGTTGDTARSRSFSYDGFSHLLSATNPENGTSIYTYDADGNVVSKTAPAPNQTGSSTVVTNFGYDALNRLLSKSYANAPAGSMTSCYTYDNAASSMYGIGRLWFEWTQNGSCPSQPPSAPLTSGYQSERVYWQYDKMGRVATEIQCVMGFCTSATAPSTAPPAPNCATPSSASGLAFCYDLAGDVTAYSNGLNATSFPQESILFSQGFDSAGRLASVGSSLTGPQLPACLFNAQSTSTSTWCTQLPTQPAYTPSGALQNWSFGQNLAVTKTYNNRLLATGETASQP